MNRRPFILKCCALVLSLVFLQKTGGGLFLHNFLHSQYVSDRTDQEPDEKSREISYNCSCIDDFQLPFVAPDVLSADQPVIEHHSTYSPAYPQPAASIAAATLLRGPPACAS